jgi:protein-L-isoaspartate(D-aspartate) O-methyltransferase
MVRQPVIRDSYAGYRHRLVEQLRSRGIGDLAVLRAVASVPRHLFVPEALRGQAYEDTSLPIGTGQTISAPSTHALVIEALKLSGTERVLEVGTGTGYQTALLSICAGQVFTIERVASLAAQARSNLESAGVANFSLLVGDGSLGWRHYAPYQAMVISAASPAPPRPLLEQLAPGGRIVLPLGERGTQVLTLVQIQADGALMQTPIAGASFVPLRGTHGFDG